MTPETVFWTALGSTGAAVFYGRFVVQWIVSERRRQSSVPLVFWYLSGIGSVALLAYAVWRQSPLGALGHNFNIAIYTRNLVHIWRSKGTVSEGRLIAFQLCAAMVVIAALGLMAYTWFREYRVSQEIDPSVARTNWVWLAIGVTGQALFALRFLVQWVATEYRRKSVIPNVFWYISLVASAMQCATFVQRREWIFAAGLAVTFLIYARNIWLVLTHPEARETVVLDR